MTTITISIDVLNAQEIVKSKKGALTSLFAGFFMSEKKLKQEVESKICEQIVGQVRAKIKEGLTQEGVVANVRYRYFHDEEDQVV